MVSRKTMARMSLYRRLLISLRDDGTSHVSRISSPSSPASGGPGAARLHGDRLLGQPDARLRGRQVHRQHRRLLDGPRRQDVALVGAASSAAGSSPIVAAARPKLAMVAAFDDDPAKIDSRFDGCRCFPVDIMGSSVRDLGIQIAIVTTPPSAAQKCHRRARPPACGAGELRRHAAAGARGRVHHRHGYHRRPRDGRLYRPRDAGGGDRRGRRRGRQGLPPRSCVSSTRCSRRRGEARRARPAASAPRSSASETCRSASSTRSSPATGKRPVERSFRPHPARREPHEPADDPRSPSSWTCRRCASSMASGPSPRSSPRPRPPAPR